MNNTFTPKQTELMRLFKRGQLKRLNILEGSVRSGKTWISLVLWALWVATQPENGNYLMVGKTLTSLKRNCLDLLETLVGEKNFTYSRAHKEGALFGRRIYLEGVNDARAESKIRGMTLNGAYCDELTLFTEDFFTMLLSRLSVKGAKLIGTTNPDSPVHWFAAQYLDRADKLNMLVMKFLIDDNTTLDPEYIANLKNEYTGVFYDRFILGEWVVAEGLIYDFFDPAIHTTDESPTDGEWYISVDYGTSNPFSAGLWNVGERRAVRVAEFYHSGRETHNQQTDEEYYTQMERLAGDRDIRSVVIDPSAASMIATILRHGRFAVRHANNDVLNGIRVTAGLLKSRRILIHRSCKNAIRELRLYAWDEKADKDKPIKQNDHAMDEMRYLCYTILRQKYRWEDWRNDALGENKDGDP